MDSLLRGFVIWSLIKAHKDQKCSITIIKFILHVVTCGPDQIATFFMNEVISTELVESHLPNVLASCWELEVLRLILSLGSHNVCLDLEGGAENAIGFLAISPLGIPPTGPPKPSSYVS